MIVGVGIDIVQVSRIKEAIQQPNFLPKILTERELSLIQDFSLERKIEWVAGRFAAKEAYFKAIANTSVERHFTKVEVMMNEDGSPKLISPFVNISVSISHEKEYAVAIVIREENV